MRILHSRQALLQSLKWVGEPDVDAHAMQDGCVEVIQMDGIFHDIVAEAIGRAVSRSLFYSATGHPHEEASGVVVATIITCCQCALRVYRAAEFSAANDECIFQ